MSKTKKVQYHGVGAYANGYLLSRVQNIDISADLGEEEARELTNTEIVEFTATNPQVSISIETNEYGSTRNIKSFAQITGNATTDIITVASFDSTSADIGIAVEEDGVLKRTAIINDAFMSSISWNYDVGGVATEQFNLEADNQTWYANTYKIAFSVMGFNPTQHATLGSGTVIIPVSGFGPPPYQAVLYKPLKQYIDGIAVTGALSATGFSYQEGTVTGHGMVSWVDVNFTDTGARYRTVVVLTGGTLPTTITQTTSTSTIGSIPRGKLDIALVTGLNDTFAAGTNFLRLQSISIDADLSREVLNELGHYRAYDRSLTYPVPVNISFSTLANDLEEWAKFSTMDSAILASSYDLTQFTKSCKLRVRIFDKQDTVVDGTRTLKKEIVISGVQVVGSTFSVDVGGNAVQDFTAKASNFTVSGSGTPGKYPLIATPTD